jgi:glycosyltransferase involved in cell wall biosynthesis
MPYKRVGLVLDVAERLRGSGATIDVVGRGPDGEWLAIEVARRGLASVVRLRGFLPEPAKAAVVGAALLQLNTSQGEGFGLSVLEAAALGVPTVAYEVDGLRDAIRDGRTGWLVGPGDRIGDVVGDAVRELADPRRRAEISGACRAWAAQFNWDRSAQMLARLLTAAMAAAAGGGLARGRIAYYLDGDGADGSRHAGPDQLAG